MTPFQRWLQCAGRQPNPRPDPHGRGQPKGCSACHVRSATRPGVRGARARSVLGQIEVSGRMPGSPAGGRDDDLASKLRTCAVMPKISPLVSSQRGPGRQHPGNSVVNVDPCPRAADLTSRRPPWAATRSRTIGRPNPNPEGTPRSCPGATDPPADFRCDLDIGTRRAQLRSSVAETRSVILLQTCRAEATDPPMTPACQSVAMSGSVG
jgi:hypothetical protein